jgi:hypothetical protein
MSEKILENVSKYVRGSHGLFENVDYVFNEDGSTNWRAMIKPEFLYVNKGWFETRSQEPPKSIDGLNDKQLLIMLGGIKEVAKLRGYRSVSYSLSRDEGNSYISASCRIDWFPNYETNNKEVSFEDYANASINNTDPFVHKFLETMACNRAFVRSVRNFLNIHIIGADEIDKSDPNQPKSYSESGESSGNLDFLKPYGLLEKTAAEGGIESFDDFLGWLRIAWKSGIYKNEKTEEIQGWKSYKDIPAKECRTLCKLIKAA